MTSNIINSAITSSVGLTDAEYRLIRDYFYKRCGIFFDDSKRYFVDKRIISRIKASGFETFRSYFSYLRFQSGHTELQHLVNLLTVNETYFFREEYQLKSMVSEVLSQLTKDREPGDCLRIWSLPCSTGEEAYSIAIYLLEYWPDLANYDIEIVGSDIDTRVLNKACAGEYSMRSVKNLSSHLRRKYFRYNPTTSTYSICDDLKSSVSFKQVNLNEDASVSSFGKFDLVFCRNLLIYFDDISRQQATDRLFDSLNPQGVLFLGHSESMSRVSSLFKVRRFNNTTGYQKSH